MIGVGGCAGLLVFWGGLFVCYLLDGLRFKAFVQLWVVVCGCYAMFGCFDWLLQAVADWCSGFWWVGLILFTLGVAMLFGWVF